MILYYFPIAHVAQNTGNKTVCDFFRDVYACICMCTFFTIFLFTGLQSVIFSEMYMLVYVCAHILLFFYLLV